jgi:hypothetical protein
LFRLLEYVGGTVKRFPFIVAILATSLVLLSAPGAADEGFTAAKARNFDPSQTRLVNASWLGGIGCPTNAKIVAFDPTGTFLLPPSKYTDPACATGDSRDKNNEGLLMAKTGPTNNNAAAVADLVGVKGRPITELGYDLRKPTAAADPRGSHCGAGAPRFDITLADGEFFFLGCNSPAAIQTGTGIGWIRLRWGGASGPLQGYLNGLTLMNIPANINVKDISIVFDEGQDTGPDNFGLAVLDNIDVNGTLIGQGGGGNGDNSGVDNNGGDGGGGPNRGGHGAGQN